MYRFVFSAFLAIAAAAHAAPAELGQLDASPTLFVVMAALNATGFDAELDSPNNVPLRNNIRQELAKRNIPSLGALKEFFTQHRARSTTQELSQYISFALTAGGPPNFAVTIRDVDVPPDVSGLTGLSPLLARFYREGDLEDLWKRSQPAIDRYLLQYHEPVANAVLQVNAYLRQPTSGFKGRHFQIFLELLAPPGQIQTRSYGNEFTIVITPSAEPRIFDVRHGYLHYLLDPMSTRFQEILDRKKALLDHAQRARALSDTYKDDFLLLATESLIKAVESRLDHHPEAAQQALLQGYLLTPYFAEMLPVYEKQEQSMMYFYPELVGAIDLVKEDARLSKVEFARPEQAAAPAPPPPPPVTGAAKTLELAEQAYKGKNLDAARKLYLDLLQQSDVKAMHAAAYYGLARIAVQQKDPETGQRLFQKTLELEPEPFVKAWALVFLGRLSMASGERADALKQFQEALAVSGASEEARKAAQQGVQQSSQP